MKKQNKVIAAVLAGIMVFSMVACGQTTPTVSESKPTTETTVQATESIPAEVVEEVKFPEEISIFASLNTGVTKAGGTDYNDVLSFKMMEEKTGTHVEWLHPAADAVSQTFNTLIASGEYPDVMLTNWYTINGGVSSYAEDGVIYELTAYIDEYMPNFSKILESDPEVRKAVTDEQGRIFVIPFLRYDKELAVFMGNVIRQDWLDACGLEMPTTPEELKNVIMTFREKDVNGNGLKDEVIGGQGFDQAQCKGIGDLVWAFGTTWDFHLKDGDVVYGPITEEYREGLAYIADLYANDLIDKEYLTNENKDYNAKIADGTYGFYFGYQPTSAQSSMEEENGVVKLVGAKFLESADGTSYCFDLNRMVRTNSNQLAVTTNCEDLEGVLSWVDQWYSEEGMMMANFGEEGVSYEIENGEPVFKDEYIYSNPNGKTSADMLNLTAGIRAYFIGGQLFSYYKQTLGTWGAAACDVWAKEEVSLERILPTLNMTVDEAAEYADIMAPIKTLVLEASNKVVTGKMTLEEWDTVVEQIKSMDIDVATKINSDAYGRYLAK